MTTITTAKLREMAHTLGQRPEYALQVFISNFDTAIDDTPADTEEQIMAMTITREQFDRFVDIRAEYGYEKALAGLGITITPAEPPEAMVKLAWEIAAVARRKHGDELAAWHVALATLQHAVDVVRNAKPASILPTCVNRADLLNALGAGGRDAG